jgi:hypothetical protein
MLAATGQYLNGIRWFLRVMPDIFANAKLKLATAVKMEANLDIEPNPRTSLLNIKPTIIVSI